MQIKKLDEPVKFKMRRKGDDLPDDENLTGDDFPRFKLVTVGGFNTPITNPVALLTGFDVEFEPSESEGEGRPFGHMEVRLDIEDVFDNEVTVRVTFGLRDWSNDWDDEHKAKVNFVVIAD